MIVTIQILLWRRYKINPYIYVQEATDNGESLLSLCCGIGLELNNLNTQHVTAVDLAPQYLDEVRGRCPQAKTIASDVLVYVRGQPDNSVDVISIIDGIEHMTKRAGSQLIPHMKRVARKQVLLFTPEGYLRNQPHNAWGIEGADHLQEHRSGWGILELKDLGFDLVAKESGISQHGEPYNALMFIYTKG